MKRFSPEEKKLLLEVKGVGATVIQRLEEIGIHSLAQLQNYEAQEITGAVSAMLGSTCWSNAPKARSAVEDAIACARHHMAVNS